MGYSRQSQVPSCGLGIRIQKTPTVIHVPRGDKLNDMNSPIQPAYCMPLCLNAFGRMSYDSQALGCPGSGNILLQRRMNYFSL